MPITQVKKIKGKALKKAKDKMLTGFISDHKILTAPKSQNAPATYKIGDCGIAQPFSMPLDKTPKDQADKRTIAATNHQSCQTLMG